MTGKNLKNMMPELLLIFFCAEKETIYPTYVSKNNSDHEKQVIILSIISNGEKWNYLTVKKLMNVIKRKIIVCIAFIPLEQKTNLNCIKNYLKIKISVM